ncbi:hypothetical protein C8F00_2673 [Xanthomonas vasicola]
MLAERRCNVCGKQRNGDTAALRVRPGLDIRIGRFHPAGDRASRSN